MNPEVKAQWLIDLRSGKYEQGQYKLRTGDNKYCCLGVLAEQGVREGIIPEPKLLSRSYGPIGEYQYDGDICSLNWTLIEWSGVSYSNTNDLIGLNDGQGKSFEEIADWIEENL